MKTIAAKAIGVSLQVGVVENDVAVDISSASIKQIKITLPSSKTKIFNANFLTDGKDGYLVYITSATSDIPETGAYSIRAYIEMTAYSGFTNPVDAFIAA